MKTRIGIPEPCHQDWNKMTILEKGRFCESCNKTVIDFTNKSQKEITREINGKKDVCGRFYTSQLKEINQRKLKTDFYLAKWAMLLGLGSILGISEPAISKTPKPKIELREKSSWKRVLPKKIEKDSIVVKGKVIGSNTNNFPLAGVIVVFEGTSIKTQTDFDGKFSMVIPAKKFDGENYLVFSYIGYKTEKHRFYKKNKYFNIDLTPSKNITEKEIIIMGGITRQSNNEGKTCH